MQKYVIQSGSFTEAGNYSGYTANQGRIFLHKKQMEGLGWKTNEEVKFPFYVIGGEKTINPFDENGKPMANEDGSLVEVKRLQAFNAFKTRQELVAALAEPQLIDLEVAKLVKAEATTAGLTSKEVESLLAASI